MQRKNKLNQSLLLSLVAASVIPVLGCQTGAFSKPDLAKLAFWKKNSDAVAQTVPPPPARHFDPAPLSDKKSEPPTEVVNLDKSSLARRFNNNPTQALSEIGGTDNEPIRKPYETGSKSTGNDFAPQVAGNVRSMQEELNSFPTSSKQELSAAQQEFQAAMASAKESATRSLSKTKQSSNDFAAGWKDDIELPTGRQPEKKTPMPNSFNQSLAAVNQSLSKANQKMSEVGTNIGNTVKTKTNEFNNQFKKNIGTATKAADNFMTGAKEKLATAAKPLTGFAPPNFAPQGVESTSNGASAELDTMQAQVAEAKQQIENLKMQVAEAKRNEVGAQFQPNQPLTPTPQRVAQVPGNDFKSTYGSGGSFAPPSKPANILRPNNPTSPKTKPASLPGVTPVQNGLSPNYPTTPHGGFIPKSSANNTGNFTPPMAATQVGFNAPRTSQATVKTAESNANGQEGKASRIQNYVSEVNIPDSILNGSGSYAPGSVNALRDK